MNDRSCTYSAIVRRIRSRALSTRRTMMWTTYGIGIVVAGVTIYYLFFGFLLPEPQSDQGSWPLIVGGITRIGAIIIALYVLQLLANFTRYGFRIADHLQAAADALDLAADDRDRLGPFIEALSPRHIGFGKSPTPSGDGAFGSIVKAVKGASES